MEKIILKKDGTVKVDNEIVGTWNYNNNWDEHGRVDPYGVKLPRGYWEASIKRINKSTMDLLELSRKDLILSIRSVL